MTCPTDEPLASVLAPGPEGAPAGVAARAARALLDLPAVSPVAPPWLAPHQSPAALRLTALLDRYGGALLADAPGLGKSYVALAVALARPRPEPFGLVVPAALVAQWRQLCRRFDIGAHIRTHESLSRRSAADDTPAPTAQRLLVVDEAHRFRNPATRRYQALARLAVGRRVLLVTATPLHNAIADLVHLLRLFLRDDALAGLGVPSLKRLAAGDHWGALPGALAHLVVARSRARAPSLVLPERARGRCVRVGVASEDRIEALVGALDTIRSGSGSALTRVVLATRLASSLPAFRDSLSRQEAFAEFAGEARRSGRTLGRADFQRLFPRGEEPDMQLALLPLLLPEGSDTPGAVASETWRRLRELSLPGADPKLERLHRLLVARPAKTIVFTSSRATARYLLRSLKGRHRVAAVMGARGLLPAGTATVAEVLRLFAPLASGVTAPPHALAIDLLIATDLASEGLNLQDASRVVNYDLPWTPARLAQRVGRIDRIGSTHARIEVISFLPPGPLARALRIESRLAAKAALGRATMFDWCDRLQAVSREGGPEGRGTVCAVRGNADAVLFVVALGDSAEPVLVRPDGVTSDPLAACALLEHAARAPALSFDRAVFAAALGRAAPAIRRRLAAVAASRWGTGDRDQLSRRLIPLAVTAARRAARQGDGIRLRRLDSLVERLGTGMTAGEELSLSALVESPCPLTADRLLEWSERLPAHHARRDAPEVRLVAAVVVRGGGAG